MSVATIKRPTLLWGMIRFNDAYQLDSETT